MADADQSDQGWRTWARSFEKTRRFADNVWSDGKLPEPGIAYLLADGFHSALGKHWLYEDKARWVDDANIRRQACGFSYAGYGLPYETEHTRVSLQVTSRRFADYIRTANEHRLVLIGFSLGAVVTLLGLREWLQQNNPSNPRDRILAVILVSPAHAVNPRLLDSYRLWLKTQLIEWKQEGPPPEIPDVVIDLATEGSPARTLATQMLSDLVIVHGIPLYVIYWPKDELTPCKRPSRKLLNRPEYQQKKVRVRDKLRNLRQAPSEHIDVRDHKETVEELLDILKNKLKI